MSTRILLSGTLGGLAQLVWFSLVNIVFQFTLRTQMTPVPSERTVHDLLTGLHLAPGTYLVNPALVNGQFPVGAPVFSIRYAGFGHEAAGLMMLVQLAVWIVAGVLAAWLLSNAAPRILARHWKRVGYVTAFGVMTIVIAIVPQWGIGGLPAGLMSLIALNQLVGWLACAIVVARLVGKPTAVAGA